MEDYNSKQVDRCLGQGIGGVGQGGRGGGSPVRYSSRSLWDRPGSRLAPPVYSRAYV